MTAELVEIQPTTRSDLDVVSRVAAAAVRLPSGHPWYVRPVDQGFEIRADHTRPDRSPASFGLRIWWPSAATTTCPVCT